MQHFFPDKNSLSVILIKIYLLHLTRITHITFIDLNKFNSVIYTINTFT